VGSPVNSSAHRLLNGLHHLHGALDLVVQRVAFVQTLCWKEVAFLDLFASPPATFDADAPNIVRQGLARAPEPRLIQRPAVAPGVSAHLLGYVLQHVQQIAVTISPS